MVQIEKSIFSGSKVAKLHGKFKYNVLKIQNVSYIIVCEADLEILMWSVSS